MFLKNSKTNMAILAMIAIIIVIIMLMRIMKRTEMFKSSYLGSRPSPRPKKLKRKRHAKIDNDGRVLGLSSTPPSLAAETHCAQVKCPPVFADDVVCWKCMEITS